ncbi:MAG: hypothetical protein KAI83_17145, partial [Thiomargarita sp.]|nr:hypothetical protein [Thiomargarita sp.]
MESKPLDLDVYWSSTLQLWAVFGVQRFSFGRLLEFNASALSVYWSSTLQLWNRGIKSPNLKVWTP